MCAHPYALNFMLVMNTLQHLHCSPPHTRTPFSLVCDSALTIFLAASCTKFICADQSMCMSDGFCELANALYSKDMRLHLGRKIWHKRDAV